jgi:hydrogenase maturation protease
VATFAASTPLATHDAPAPPTLVIGVGNPDRGDDGAGLAVARRLRAAAPPGVVVREATGEASELLDAWDGFARVIVVDAARSGSRPGTLMRFDAIAAPLPAGLARESTHGWGVAEAIELARALGRLPPSLVVYAIEGRGFEPGDALSPEVAVAAERLADTLAARRPAAHAPAGS